MRVQQRLLTTEAGIGTRQRLGAHLFYYELCYSGSMYETANRARLMAVPPPVR